MFDKENVIQEKMKKEAVLDYAFKTPVGLQKLAQALGNPVKKHLDIKGIARKLFVTEPYTDSGPMYYDADIEEFDAVKIGRDGTTKTVVVRATRTIVPEFEVVCAVRVPYSEIRTRKYKVVERAKERLKQSFSIKEDLTIFSLIHDGAVLANQEVVVAGNLPKEALSYAFLQAEQRRILPVNVVGSPSLVFSMRNWERDQIEETARIELRRTGYLGVLWGANFMISQLIKPITANSIDYHYGYVVGDPQLVGWYPIRADVEIIPADEPSNLLLGWIGYLQCGMILHNPWGVARVGYIPTIG